MALPNNVVHLVFEGNLPGGEIWQTGIWFSDTGVTDVTSLQTWLDAVAVLFGATGTSSGVTSMLTALAGLGTTWTEARAYHYAGGSAPSDYSAAYTLATPKTGSGSNLPDQLCCVVTLNTGFAGRRNRGRMYFPANASTTYASTGQIDSGNAGTAAIDWGTVLTAVKAAGHGTPVVVSRVAGSARPITQVAVDTRADIQRRRANRQAITARIVQPVT